MAPAIHEGNISICWRYRSHWKCYQSVCLTRFSPVKLKRQFSQLRNSSKASILELTRISRWRAAEPALRKRPSTSTFSIISVHASDTNFGTRHTLPLDNFTSVNSKFFNGTLKTLWCPTNWNESKIDDSSNWKFISTNNNGSWQLLALPVHFCVFCPFDTWYRKCHVIHLRLIQANLHYLAPRSWTW